MNISMRRLGIPALLVGALAYAPVLISRFSARAADDGTAPILNPATLSPKPDGNPAGGAGGIGAPGSYWYRSLPVTVTLSASDPAGIAKLEYSLDGGKTSVEVPTTPGPSVKAAVRIDREGITDVRYWAIDTNGNYSVGDAATPPAPAGGRGGFGGGRGPGGPGGAAGARGRGPGRAGRGPGAFGRGGAATITASSGATAGSASIRLSSTGGLNSGEKLYIGSGPSRELVTIDHVAPAPSGDSAGASPESNEPNVFLQAPLKKDHTGASDNGVFTVYRTEAVMVDTLPPVAEWPSIVDDKIMQSETLTPTLSDPRRQTPDDREEGSGGTAIWLMQIDRKHVYPFPQHLDLFTIGKHSQMLTLLDVAGNAMNYTRTFLVTTSFDDLGKVLDEYSSNALSTTLATPAAAGDTGLRLSEPLGFRAGETLVIGTGDNKETIKIASVPSPPPPQQGANVILAAPLKQAHDAGNATPVNNPRPEIPEAAATHLRALLKDASGKADSGQKAAAIADLKQFSAAVQRQVAPASQYAEERAALTSAAQSLTDQLNGKQPEVAGLGLTSSPAQPSLRIFTDPHPFVHNPNAMYKILVNGHAGSFRHEHIVDTEAMIQDLGAANGFDVDIWDPIGTVGPGRQIPPGVSLATSPFLDLDTLKQYKMIVFDSTVGRDPTGSLNTEEFANFKKYIESGGGFLAIHGGIDAYQDVPWYVDLDGGGFSGHGGNARGIVPDCMSCGEVEMINVDPSYPATRNLEDRFAVHDELYNTSRNPVELDIVHPLLLENESTLIGEINVSTGPLMNSDRHGMVWCRNFDGGRSFVSLLGHNWQLTHEKWYQQMILGGIQWTAGAVLGNCVTYTEARDVLAAGVASGEISGTANSALSAPLSQARAEYDKGNYKAALVSANAFLSQAEKQRSACTASAKACSDGGAALGKVHEEGVELVSWMKTLER